MLSTSKGLELCRWVIVRGQLSFCDRIYELICQLGLIWQYSTGDLVKVIMLWFQNVWLGFKETQTPQIRLPWHICQYPHMFHGKEPEYNREAPLSTSPTRLILLPSLRSGSFKLTIVNYPLKSMNLNLYSDQFPNRERSWRPYLIFFSQQVDLRNRVLHPEEILRKPRERKWKAWQTMMWLSARNRRERGGRCKGDPLWDPCSICTFPSLRHACGVRLALCNCTRSEHLWWTVFPGNLEFRPSILLLVSIPSWDRIWDTWGFLIPSWGLSREREGFSKSG